MAADLRAARPEAPAGELVTPGNLVGAAVLAPAAVIGAGWGVCQYAAVTPPYFSLYSGLLRGRVRRSAACAPGRFKGRYRADDAARPGNRLHRCADRRSCRAVFHRLEPVPAAIRGRGDANHWHAGPRRRQ